MGAPYRTRGSIARLADFIWPPRSLLSDEIVSEPGAIEPARWAELQFLTEPLCFRCGYPLTEQVGPAAACGACAANPPALIGRAPRSLMTTMPATSFSI